MSCCCEIFRGLECRLGVGTSPRWSSAAVLAAGMLLLLVKPVAADYPTIVRVEEDWELVVQLPEVNTDAPQVTCVISPGGDLFGVYASFELNHHTQPEYAAGGLQLQLWSEGFPVASSASPNQTLLQQQSETIRWTQWMRIHEGRLKFDVVDGTSTTWGNFGGQGTLKVSLPTELHTLAGYQPGFSADHSGVGYASNRVTSLKLREVRWYSDSDLVARDTTDRVVHSQED